MANLVQIARDAVEAFNSGDWDRFAETAAPDVTYEEIPAQEKAEGRDAMVRWAQIWKEAFPDGRGTVTNAIASDDTVVLEVTWEGTHSGPLKGPAGTIAPTGRRSSMRAVQVLRFEGDKVKENRHYYDVMGLLQELGIMPQPQQV